MKHAVAIPRVPARGFARTPTPQRVRQYAAARIDRTTSDWLASGASANVEVQQGLVRMRDRARTAERDNDYVRQFLWLAEKNVLGAHGMRLQVQSDDRQLASEIERAWRDFGRRGNFTATRTISKNAFERMVLRAVLRDGEVLVAAMAVRAQTRGDRRVIDLGEVSCF